MKQYLEFHDVVVNSQQNFTYSPMPETTLLPSPV
jgi:hypothetical protein